MAEIFVKLLNDDLVHNGITYKEGVLVKASLFDEITEHDYGLHFCSIDQIDKWLCNFGKKIGLVVLESDSKIIKFNDHYKTNKMKIVNIGYIWEHELFDRIMECKSANLCALLAKYNQIDKLIYAHTNGQPWDDRTCSNAAGNGHLECLKYAHENDCSWDDRTCSNAAYNGHLECLKYAHDNGCPWDTKTCSNAAWTGAIECLRYAHENGCPWDRQTCFIAVVTSQTECLKYAVDNKCPGYKEFIHMLQ